MAQEPQPAELTDRENASLRRIARILFWVLWIPASLGLLEVVIRLSEMDKHALAPLLYYFDAAPGFHAPSHDARVLFSLKPSVSSRFFHKRGHRHMTFSHNSLGYRGKEPRAPRDPKVFRIITVGASNLYGAEVSDDETMPVYLERLLNAKFRGKFEVWNQGVQAQSLQQASARGEQAIKAHAPDLLLVQLAHNMRRSFLAGHPTGHYFDQDPTLYRENLRYIPLAGSGWGLPLVQRWALYRTVVTLLNYWDRVPSNNPHYPRADSINKEAFLDFHARNHQRTRIVFLPNLPIFAHAMRAVHRERFKAVPSIDVLDRALLQNALRPEFFETHPPPHVYEANAYVIARELARLYPRQFRPRGVFTMPLASTFGARVKDRFRRDPLLFDHIVDKYRTWGKVDSLLRLLGVLARAEPQNPLYPVIQAQCAALLGRMVMARAYLMEAQALGVKPELRQAIRRVGVLMGEPNAESGALRPPPVGARPPGPNRH